MNSMSGRECKTHAVQLCVSSHVMYIYVALQKKCYEPYKWKTQELINHQIGQFPDQKSIPMLQS